MKTVYVLQHVACETLGTIAEALAAHGAMQTRHIRPFAGESIPARMDDAAGLIVMGGPMGVYETDQHPFLKQERSLIEQASASDTPVLGICLGSQLIAQTLGANVRKGQQKEIGWHPLTLTDAARADPLWKDVGPSFIGYHWHGDIFDVPPGAVSLASSALTPCQAFRHGAKTYGFLFHMEVTVAIIDGMIATFAGELREARLDGEAIRRDVARHLAPLNRIGATVFRRWARLL